MSDEGHTANVEKEEGEEETADDRVEIDLLDSPNYDDIFSDSEGCEYTSEHEMEWEKKGEKHLSRETIDWEKEVKKTVQLNIEPKEEQKSIYKLDSYALSGPSTQDFSKLSTTDLPTESRRQVQYSDSMGVPGIARIHLTPLTQKVIGCVIGEHVSTEYPWVYVRKEIIEDNIDLHEDSSDFLPVKQEIRQFPNTKILIGYVPSLTQEGQFYICLSEEGRDVVMDIIQKQREDHENRVKTAVYKPIGEWQELGSSIEIDETIVANTRPLLEIELVSTGDLLNASPNLVDRKADDQKDGYIELLHYRQIFKNISRILMYNATQVTPTVRDIKVQTELSLITNSWNQYKYDYQPPDISAFDEVQLESFKSFLRRFTNEVCDKVLLNTTWNIYANDYWNLVRDIRDTQCTVHTPCKEHLSFHDNQYVVERVINDLCWHQLWSGIVFATYTRYSKCHHLLDPKTDDEIIQAHEDNFVLVWSFTDCLSPKLILECPREVTSVAANPIDENLIVGGCANGQVVIWHIPGKIEQVEAVIVRTPSQVKYRIAIQKLSTWLKEVVEASRIKPTAMSSLKDSQKAGITQVSWMSPYDRLDENGRITSLPKDTIVDNLNFQFVTSSEDGTIAFWDLKPHYILVVQHPNMSRRQVITTLSIYVPKLQKVYTDVAPSTQDISIRRFYKTIIKKPDFGMEAKILVGTVEGDIGCITWEGYEFTTDMTINSETCKWSWSNRVHDGPITQTIRSKYNKSVVATVGGKIFCIWKDDFNIPLISKKSNVGYTAFCWGSFRPTVIVLTRMDGSVEIWDFIVKSEEPLVVQSLSGRLITGVYTHELHLEPQCVGFCDFNGTLRIYLSPVAFLKYDKSNKLWMNNFIERQYQRIKKCQKWQKLWTETHRDQIEETQMLVQHIAMKKQLEEEERAKVKTEVTEVPDTETKQKPVKSWKLVEKARERWQEMELKRMQQVILEKKGLRKDELERQREPILKMRQEAKKKKEKLQETLNMREEIFEHTVHLFFPKHKSVKQVSLTTAAELSARKTKKDNLSETIFQQEELQGLVYVDPNEEIVKKFMETQAEALAYLQKNPFVHTFNWRKILNEGRSRRVLMDYKLVQFTKQEKIGLNNTFDLKT